MKFKQTLRGFSSKTLAIRLKELEANDRPTMKFLRAEYRLTNKGQELVESVISLTADMAILEIV